jgi:hypothetical protein
MVLPVGDAGRATMLVTAMDEILGTHRARAARRRPRVPQRDWARVIVNEGRLR